jgi:hypothetical protein
MTMRKERARKVLHVRVRAGHKLYVHGLPDTGSIMFPSECAGIASPLSLLYGGRGERVGVGVHNSKGSSENHGSCKHGWARRVGTKFWRTGE